MEWFTRLDTFIQFVMICGVVIFLVAIVHAIRPPKQEE
jgi:hypothetical protein